MKLFLQAFYLFIGFSLTASAQDSLSERASAPEVERAFSAGTLNVARAGFISNYGFNPRDCDPIDTGWVCSELHVSESTPLTGPQIAVSSLYLEETPVCTAYGALEENAQSAFSAECPWRVRLVCSPVTSGGWACSTSAINNVMPVELVVQEEQCTAYGSSLNDAQSEFSAQCPWQVRNYCNPVNSGGWACSTDSIVDSKNVFEVTTAVAVAVAVASSAPAPAPASSSVIGTGVMNTTYQPGDLVVIAHDSGPDTDDMQAIVANRMIMDFYSDVNHVLVGSAQGHNWASPTAGSASHTQSMFPDWVDAKANTKGTTSFDGESVITIANVIESTLNNQGTVHIAEGGPSDFTAEVIRLLQSRGVSGANLKRIRVVQHSAGSSAWNEQQTSRENIALVKSVATWVPIANGNVGGNATADFQEPAGSSMCQRYMNAALSSRYSSQWAWAYSKIDDSRKCDQSDSVELLYILNDGSTKTFDQFASRYM